MIKKIFFPSLFLLILSSCALPRAVINQDYDFSSVQSVAVGNFAPGPGHPGSGASVQSVFIRQLLERGYNVRADIYDADAVIEGSVTVYAPDQRYLVRAPAPGHVVYNDIVAIGGSNVYDLGPAFGVSDGSRIVASNAAVGLYVYMVDNASGEIVWSNSYTYEGLDLAAALEGVVRFLLRSLPENSLNQ